MSAAPELNYMTQIVFLLYEDTQQSPDSPLRYTVSIHFSPGVRHREKFLNEGTCDNRPSSHGDQRLSIHDLSYKLQATCPCPSCNGGHPGVLNQRMNRLVSLAGQEKRASPFRKLSHPLYLIDLKNDYEDLQAPQVSRGFSRRLSLSLTALMATVAKRHVLRRVKSETVLSKTLDAPEDEEEDDCTPQLHSPQMSNSVSSASLHGWFLLLLVYSPKTRSIP